MVLLVLQQLSNNLKHGLLLVSAGSYRALGMGGGSGLKHGGYGTPGSYGTQVSVAVCGPAAADDSKTFDFCLQGPILAKECRWGRVQQMDWEWVSEGNAVSKCYGFGLR